MKNKIVASGWRWEISVAEVDGQQIATKSAKDESKKWALMKERKILQYLQWQGIDFVPQLIDYDDNSFSYPWIEGEHFWSWYEQADIYAQQKWLLSLLDCAYQLDTVWVVHGEMMRPWTNILIDGGEISVLDFERGVVGDSSGRNMKHVAQRLQRQWQIDKQTCTALGNMDIDDIYTNLQNHIQGGDIWSSDDRELFGFMTRIHFLFVPLTLVALDQVSKYFFYDLQRGSSSDWISPSFNTGIARSIPVGAAISSIFTVIFLIWLMRWYRSQAKINFGSQNFSYRQFILMEFGTILLIWWAIGNLIDRLRLEWVRDFIDISLALLDLQRPIFNFADVFVIVGVWLLILYEYTS